MGECKDAVSGTGPKPKKDTDSSPGNFLKQVETLMDDLSDIIQIKDEDTLSEGDEAKPENVRKAALLRASHTLLVSVKTLLGEY